MFKQASAIAQKARVSDLLLYTDVRIVGEEDRKQSWVLYCTGKKISGNYELCGCTG